MDKKLPKIFINDIGNIKNNEEIFYENKQIKNTNNLEKKDDDVNLKDNNNFLNINKKINQIFASSKYVYKADVKIKLKDKIINKKIIGRNKYSLITMDNEIIYISDILDIEF